MKSILQSSLPLMCAFILTASCTGNKTRNSELNMVIEPSAEAADTSNKTVKFGNTLFSLPSPYQLSIIVQKSGAKFDESLLNPRQNNQKYNSTYKKCVNMGIYGADLAYVEIYEQPQLIMSIFPIIKVLANDLDLMSTFTKELVDRVECNIDNRDSLLYILSNTFRDVDVFLKECQRQREGALILAGGWVESMYILTQLAATTKSDELRNRVGESKQPLENLIKILSPFYDEMPDAKSLIDNLISLSNDYDNVIQHYTYKVPEIDIESHTTIIKSVTEVVVSDDDLKKITHKVQAIRQAVID